MTDTRVVASVRNAHKRFGDVTALDDVSFDIEENRIYGLLGRNGAGKTTIMQILTGQSWADSGTVEVFGHSPYENAGTLSNVCFIKESQRYPDDFRVKHVLTAAARLLPRWDNDFAELLLDDFDLPTSRKVKKLSRGMTSALGVIIGLASRAPLTFFDEPYLGLDAASRQMFYDRLLEDYAENPRTVILSTHLIDEVSDLIEHVVLIDRGTVVLDDETDNLRGRTVSVSGPATRVDEFTTGHGVVHREKLGSLARATITGHISELERSRARSLGLELEPVSLQQLVVSSTTNKKETVA
ncbi:ABC transporter ATP-binding protein [Rhodococcoides trifolii]|uniref:ABC transporter ATP-binding protein n=1 Tax=Rhodococcoides trifolii TaxID=908250 RepID=A0A917FVS0_9NOCA|nr:ABC transporter ATP-binding protein [Rhodococcus trifolii]GGG07450.1 ABC transporter ATP-binding protein [Rhodococcus trifolii]